jgi:hypothetical protein
MIRGDGDGTLILFPNTVRGGMMMTATEINGKNDKKIENEREGRDVNDFIISRSRKAIANSTAGMQ